LLYNLRYVKYKSTFDICAVVGKLVGTIKNVHVGQLKMCISVYGHFAKK